MTDEEAIKRISSASDLTFMTSPFTTRNYLTVDLMRRRDSPEGMLRHFYALTETVRPVSRHIEISGSGRWTLSPPEDSIERKSGDRVHLPNPEVSSTWKYSDIHFSRFLHISFGIPPEAGPTLLTCKVSRTWTFSVPHFPISFRNQIGSSNTQARLRSIWTLPAGLVFWTFDLIRNEIIKNRSNPGRGPMFIAATPTESSHSFSDVTRRLNLLTSTS
jgi:hypothetical protein